MSEAMILPGAYFAQSSRRAGWLYTVLVVLVLVALVLNLGHGSLDIGWSELVRLLLDGPNDDPRSLVVWNIRQIGRAHV